ncbi:MAG: MBL fold metallo-hydrolase [Cytophagales bacterium]|nr:MBL fold metallo-hydrolase [Cytophagales bacterium]
MIQIKAFTFNPFMENTYLVYDTETKEGALVDPGCNDQTEQQELHRFIKAENIELKHLLNTHCHIDHVLGNAWAKETFGLPLGIHRADLPILESNPVTAQHYGFPLYQHAEADYFIEEGQMISIGNSEWKVIWVPGHAPGNVAFYCEKQKACLVGDALFRQSIGRTDLPLGDYDTLISSIRTKLFALPDDTTVYSGHGETTTVGEEKRTNPFCRLN